MMLWEAFGSYEKVMDVYLSSVVRSGQARSVNFAFVRYKLRDEMTKAILEGNDRKMDGRFIKVKEALYRKEKLEKEAERLSQYRCVPPQAI
ncbi:hypothetical protein REPUB_Repub11eG0041000 [Reevesia pubescens]